MKKLLLIIVLGVGLFQIWDKYGRSVQPLYAEPYVAVYGRDSCGFTKKMLSDLKSSGVNYRYFIVDDQSVANELHARMEASGISIRRYNLPVVDVNGHLAVRPSYQDVISRYSINH